MKLPGPLHVKGNYPAPLSASYGTRGTYKLTAKWQTNIEQAQVISTPVLTCSAIVCNSTLLATRAAYLSANFGSVNMLDSGEYVGRANVYDRWISSIVVGYRITLSNIVCHDQAGDNIISYLALTPISAIDDLQLTNAHPNTTWPGITVNDGWRNCQLQRGSRWVTIGGSGYAEPKDGMAKSMTLSMRMDRLIADPLWKAAGASTATGVASGGYTEVSASGVASAYRQQVMLSLFTADPEVTRTTRYHMDVHEECWIECFDPVLTGQILLSEKKGAEAASAYLQEQSRLARESKGESKDDDMSDLDSLCDLKVIDTPTIPARAERAAGPPEKLALVPPPLGRPQAPGKGLPPHSKSSR